MAISSKTWISRIQWDSVRPPRLETRGKKEERKINELKIKYVEKKEVGGGWEEGEYVRCCRCIQVCPTESERKKGRERERERETRWRRRRRRTRTRTKTRTRRRRNERKKDDRESERKQAADGKQKTFTLSLSLSLSPSRHSVDQLDGCVSLPACFLLGRRRRLVLDTRFHTPAHSHRHPVLLGFTHFFLSNQLPLSRPDESFFLLTAFQIWSSW